MYRVVIAAMLAALVSSTPVSAQDDLDALMSGDPERPEEPAEDAEATQAQEEGEASEEHAPEEEGLSEERLSMSDDERPPGDEPKVRAPERETAEAEASDDGHPNPLSLGVLLGYGISMEDGPNPWAFGFGVSGGYNFSAFYLGARFVYYAGSTATEVRYGVLGDMRTEDVSANLWELGIEGGFDITAADFVIRPGLGFGFASASGGSTQTYTFIAPGVGLLYGVSESVFLGIDTRYQVVLAEQATQGLVLLANLGMRF